MGINQSRLRQLALSFKHEITIFSAHDAIEYLSMRESGETHLILHGPGPDEAAELGLS
jgi:hypothetical protein